MNQLWTLEEAQLFRSIALISCFCLLGCRQNTLHVISMPMPDYPSPARYGNVQGTVNVKVSIGPDGNVIFASGSGAPEILIQAATENAKNWRFGPFPTVSEFPIEHTIQFTYVLEGKATVVAPRPTVRTFLPDRIEVQAVPLVSDYSPIEDYKPLPQPKDLGKQHRKK